MRRLILAIFMLIIVPSPVYSNNILTVTGVIETDDCFAPRDELPLYFEINADSIYHIGKIFLRNFPSGSYDLGIRLLDMAAKNGHSEASKLLNQKYREAVAAFERNDFDFAFNLFRAFLFLGKVEARYYTGIIYLTKWQSQEFIRLGMDLISMAAVQGEAKARVSLERLTRIGVRDFAREHYLDAEKKLLLFANDGDSEAQYYLGCLYGSEREGLQPNYIKSVMWLKKSADLGNVNASRRYESRYQSGMKLYESGNYGEAHVTLEPYAYVGDMQLQYFLGELSLKLFHPDYFRAVYWFDRAAKLGSLDARKSVDKLYRDGIEAYGRGAYVIARDKLTPFAKNGDAKAQYAMGMIYGDWLENRDYEEKVRWLIMAAEQGYADAQISLGWMYLDGRGVAQSYKQAVRWFWRGFKNIWRQFGSVG